MMCLVLENPTTEALNKNEDNSDYTVTLWATVGVVSICSFVAVVVIVWTAKRKSNRYVFVPIFSLHGILQWK